MSLQHIQKNSPRLLPKPAKFEKNPPNGYRVIRKTKCGAGGAAGAAGAGGAGGARSSPIHKQASLAGRLTTDFKFCIYRDYIQKLDLRIGEPIQICIHWKDNSPRPVNHRLTLKEGPKAKSNIRRFLAQDFV